MNAAMTMTVPTASVATITGVPDPDASTSSRLPSRCLTHASRQRRRSGRTCSRGSDRESVNASISGSRLLVRAWNDGPPHSIYPRSIPASPWTQLDNDIGTLRRKCLTGQPLGLLGATGIATPLPALLAVYLAGKARLRGVHGALLVIVLSLRPDEIGAGRCP
jgi:hypothetical protein